MFLTRNFYLLISIVHYAELAPCPDVPKLNFGPGLGWDAFADKDAGQLLRLTYDQCKVTNDGMLLIPDNVAEVSLDEQGQELNAEIIEHWSTYTGPTSAGFKVATEQFLPVYYSFSDGYNEMKGLQVKHEAVTCRSELRRAVYRLHTTSDATMDEVANERFLQVIGALERNDNGQARYLAEMIVRDYGTHYSKIVDVGAVLVMEDYLSDDFFKANEDVGQRSKILSAAKLSLLESTDVSWKYTEDSSLLSEYNAATLEKKIRFFGEVSEKMVAIDRSGDSLSSLVISSNFPLASPGLLTRARQVFSDVIRDYYVRNIYRGCTRPKSPNFDFAANFDDGSCNSAASKYTFGGVYVKCEEQFSPRSEVEICDFHIRVPNPLTGYFSCPPNFTPEVHYSRMYFKYNNESSFGYLREEFVSCMANDIVGKGYLFGGLYSNDVVNIQTKRKTCPPFYTAVRAKMSLRICISNADNDSAKRYALPFGGFASCSNEYQCPTGYKRHLAIRYDPYEQTHALVCGSGNIYYCLQEPDVIKMEVLPPLIRPPFENTSDCGVRYLM